MQESAKECERIETASHCKRNSLDIHTPDFMQRKAATRGVTQHATNRRMAQKQGQVSALRNDSIFASIMSDTPNGISPRKTVNTHRDSNIHDMIRLKVNSKLDTDAAKSTRASTNPRQRNSRRASETDYISLNKRLQSLSKTMGREGTMGNSAFKKHHKVVFPMTSLKDKDEPAKEEIGSQLQSSTSVRPHTQVSNILTPMRGGERQSTIVREQILQQRRTIQKLNESTCSRMESDNAHRIFFPSAKHSLNQVPNHETFQMVDESRQDSISYP